MANFGKLKQTSKLESTRAINLRQIPLLDQLLMA